MPNPIMGVRIDPGLRRAVEEEAQHRGVSLSDVVRDALRAQLRPVLVRRAMSPAERVNEAAHQAAAAG